jgi:nucleoid DNA-binding protein
MRRDTTEQERALAMSAKGKKAAKGHTKAQIEAEVAAKAGLTKAQVHEVFSALSAVVGAELKAGRPVTVAGLVKVTLVHKPATPARPGRNPFTGEAITIKAKPSRKVVRVRAVKALKDMA